MSDTRRTLAALAAGLLAVLAWELSGLDLPLSRLFGDASGFPARDAFWARGLLHEGLRWLWALIWLLLLIDALRRAPVTSGPTRRERRLALLVGLGLLLLAPLLKSFSQSSCPWSLTEFGGTAPWVSHWDWARGDGGPGRCFPSGHGLGAMAFAPFAWLWRRRSVWLLLVTGAALAGIAQLARGAHFLSHSLWSAWLGLALGWLGLWAWTSLDLGGARPSRLCALLLRWNHATRIPHP
jgi:membrane-associated PAP2 superfamily phosphatase